MPLLLHEDYPDIDMNKLNRVKKRINRSALVQFTKIGNIQSTIQPTKEEINNYFIRITTFFNQLYQQLRIVINAGNYPRQIFFEVANKLTQDFTPQIIQLATEFNLKINPYYNYVSPQQNETIKQDIIKLQNIFEEILFMNAGDQIDNFIEVGREQLTPISDAVNNYAPLKINIKPSKSRLFENLEGGYIGGGRFGSSLYPETRFL